MKLKMCTTDKHFGKICLKAIRDTFFQPLICNYGRDGMINKGKGEDSTFWLGVISSRRVDKQ